MRDKTLLLVGIAIITLMLATVLLGHRIFTRGSKSKILTWKGKFISSADLLRDEEGLIIALYVENVSQRPDARYSLVLFSMSEDLSILNYTRMENIKVKR